MFALLREYISTLKFTFKKIWFITGRQEFLIFFTNLRMIYHFILSPKRRRHYTISLSVIIGIFSHLKKERKRRRERKQKTLQINL